MTLHAAVQATFKSMRAQKELPHVELRQMDINKIVSTVVNDYDLNLDMPSLIRSRTKDYIASRFGDTISQVASSAVRPTVTRKRGGCNCKK